MAFLCDPCRSISRLGRPPRWGWYQRARSQARARVGLPIRATFEVVAEGLGAQDSVTGGGRYDGLIEASAAAHAGHRVCHPFERLVTALEHHGLTIPEPRLRVFVAAGRISAA
jgi:hypothetical protein